LTTRSMRILCLLLLSALVVQAAPTANEVIGTWKGTLAIDKAKLRLVFRIGRTPEERLVAKMDSIDQGAHDLPVDEVSFKDQTLRLQLKFIQGGYEGQLQPGGNKIEGKWTQSGKSYPLTITRVTGKEVSDEEQLTGAELAASKEAAQKLGGPWA